MPDPLTHPVSLKEKAMLRVLLAVAVLATAVGRSAAQNPQSDLPARVSELERRVENIENHLTKGSALPQSTLPVRGDDPWARPPGMKSTASAYPNKCGCKTAPGGVRTCGRYDCPANGGKGPCLCESAKTVIVDSTYRAAPVVAATAPFDPGAHPFEPRGASYTTPAISVPTVASASTYRLVPVQSGARTSIGVPTATYGITSGCANGACAASTSYGRRGLFR